MFNSVRVIIVLLILTLVAVGCDQHFEPAGAPYDGEMLAVTNEYDLANKAPAAPKELSGLAARSQVKQSATDGRRIIHTAMLQLVVSEFDGVSTQVADLAESFEGFIARSELRGDRGRPRGGSWTVRVPSARYREFLAAATELGEIKSQTTESQEVTEEYVDLQARLRNKEKEEARLLEHLAVSTGKLDEILQVEREISRVRGEVEQMQGRLRVLDDLTTLCTVRLGINEIRDYTPAQTESPGFGGRISTAWWGSLGALNGAGQAVVLFFVALGPWLIVLALPGWMAWRSLRRRLQVRAVAVCS